MLVLTRKPGAKVVIDGGITVTVVRVLGNRVRLAFDAPATSLLVWSDNSIINAKS
jgi:carbon storage regulator CsrA